MSSSPGSPAPRLSFRRAGGWLALTLALGSTACTRMIVSRVGAALRADGTVFAAEDDPELVREAVPFGLKTLESLLETAPEDPNLLLAAASGFTQYAYAFVLQDAQMLEESQPTLAKEKTERARRLFQRAWRYGFRSLEARHKGFAEQLRRDPGSARVTLSREDVPHLYWTGVALAAHISLAKGDMQLVGRLPEVETLLGRALELDEAWNDGSIHEFFLVYEGGRGSSRAQAHYDRVLALTDNQKLGPLVTWAETVCVQRQDRKRFMELLDKVLAFDADSAPRFRLVNLVAQRRARWLRSRAADLFLEE